MDRRGDSFVLKDSSETISFSAFVLGLTTTCLIHLGERPNPDLGKLDVNLDLARETLDLLDLLHVKTRGNLTADEEKLFTSVLTDLRLRYVEKQNG